ncbi:hypothetical protein HDU79_000419 [Rhizoclosmatium sp. JEL0117]|nr:hypothetical protein HDU79_000419 [Rhizoclosmatium sp. JEL0117]
MVEEWFSLFDTAEMIACHKELGSNDYNVKFLLHLLNETLSKKAEIVAKTANVLAALFSAECISLEDVTTSFTEVASLLDDISIDIPAAYKHFGTFYGALLAENDQVFTLETLREILDAGIETPMRKPPVPQVLAQALETVRVLKSENDLVRTFANEGIDLQLFWPAAKRSEEVVAAWKADNKLTCLDNAPVDDVVVESELLARLNSEDVSSVSAWIQETVDETTRSSTTFIRELTSSILEVVGSKTLFVNGVDAPVELTRDLFVEEENLIESHKELFDLCLGQENRSELEVEILLACQEYWHRTGAISGFLEHLFRIFTKQGIVDVASEGVWRDNTDSEQESKALALDELATYLQSRS